MDNRPARFSALRWLMLLTCLLAVMCMFVSTDSAAHELRPAVADMTRVAGEPPDADTLRVQLRMNIEALIAGVGIEHDDTDASPQAADYDALRALEPAALRERLDAFLPELTEGLELVDDQGQRLPVTLGGAELPEVGDVRVARDSILELEAPVPAGSTSVSWSWPDAFGPVIVRSADAEGPQAFSVYLLAGDKSDQLSLDAMDAMDADESSSQSATAGSSDTASAQASRSAPAGTFANYLRVGFVHIVPLGLDHILFVIGLFLLAPRAKPILWQVTTFTLAHSITLALATLGYVTLPGSIVEPLIALSIVAIAVENLFVKRLHPWRLLIVFGFGLLHGLGFASVLQDVGGSSTAFLTTLVAFNIGVELGQLSVVAVCFLLVGLWFRNKPWYRRVVTIPGSLLIGAVGLFWFVERTMG